MTLSHATNSAEEKPAARNWRRGIERAGPVLLIVALVILWQVLTRAFEVPNFLLPAPTDVARLMVDEWPLAATPKPVWNADAPQAMDFDAQWLEVPDNEPFRNSYRQGWEQFLRHVADDEPLRSTALEGSKDVQLTELCYQSDRERRWVDVPNLEGA